MQLTGDATYLQTILFGFERNCMDTKFWPQGAVPQDWAQSHARRSDCALRGRTGNYDWLPPRSIMSTYATDKSELMGHKGIFAGLFGLLQRIRNQCGAHTNGMVFFDEGHKTYIRLYRMAQKYLPTGSKFGSWENGKLTRNLPLTMFPKDANIKCSGLVVLFADRRSCLLFSKAKTGKRTWAAFCQTRRKRAPPSL